MEITRLDAADAARVGRAAHLFDDPPTPDATTAFLADDRHHLLFASVDGVDVGFVSGVEMVHPDKGVEMFLYELGVDDAHRRRGAGRALVEALADLARARGCYGMWVLTDADNDAALATYHAAGARPPEPQVVLDWRFDDPRPGGPDAVQP